jgi:hypothetical protein
MKYRYILVSLGILWLGVKFILPKILEKYLGVYMMYLVNQELSESSGNFTRLFFTGIFLYCMIILRFYKDFEKYRGLLSIVTIGTSLPYLFGGHTGGRIAEYFLVYFILLIPNVNLRVHINKRVIMLFVFYLFFFIYLWTTVYKSNSTAYIPYRFYFSTDRARL